MVLDNYLSSAALHLVQHSPDKLSTALKTPVRLQTLLDDSQTC